MCCCFVGWIFIVLAWFLLDFVRLLVVLVILLVYEILVSWFTRSLYWLGDFGLFLRILVFTGVMIVVVVCGFSYICLLLLCWFVDFLIVLFVLDFCWISLVGLGLIVVLVVCWVCWLDWDYLIEFICHLGLV